MDKHLRALACTVAILGVLGVAEPVAAQSLTGGVLRGTVTSREGAPIRGVQLTIEGRDGRAVTLIESAGAGEFSVSLLPPGSYRVLAEQVGYQPVRVSGVNVVAGQTTTLAVKLVRKPPPITSVDEQVASGAISGSSEGRVLDARALTSGDRYRAVTDIGRGLSEVDGPRDGRDGFALAAAGLPGTASRLVVDGVPELLLRHPGVPGALASAPLFQRDAVSQAGVLGLPLDAEWRGYPGTILAAQTARGSNRLSFRPYLAGSGAKLGGRKEDNPADSAGTSIQAGAVLSGAIVPDTAHFLLRFDYQRLRTPSAAPWENDSASYRGGPVALATTIGAIAKDTFHTTAVTGVAPVVHTWKGGSGMGRLDWRLNRHAVAIRGGYAKWDEDAPLLGGEPSLLAGASLSARDWSGAVSLTSTWTDVTSELRAGVAGTKRDWLGAAIPATSLAAEGAAFGSSGALPAKFEETSLDIGEAVQFVTGPHRLKGGADLSLLKYRQAYRFGSSGIYTFGGLDGFGRGEGTFFQATGSGAATAEPNLTDAGLFLQDTWSVSPEISVTMGIRYDRQKLPKDKIALDQKLVDDAGIKNTNRPDDKNGVSPRIGFVWDVRNRGEWVVRADAGLFKGRLDPATFAEAMLYDGGTTIRRGQGTFASWPAAPAAALAPDVGARITLFGDGYRSPRALKASGGLSRFLAGGVAVHVTGSYYHTDYLLRRTDLNLVEDQLTQTSDGRPVYGSLVQQGGLISAAPGSNRRFADFDLVSGLAPTGFSDYYEVTALAERRSPSGLSLAASYTYSRTRDNLTGALEPDPADQLNPFPQGIAGADWSEGRSDLDVPHRFAGSAEYRSRGRSPVTVGARWRYRSGLPFTPGFRPGVDVNGDGGGRNDPAFLDAAVSGLSAALAAGRCEAAAGDFAKRNSCREPSVNGLDLYLALGLPVARSAPGATGALRCPWW
jgi:carboxypeptidase family protein